MGRLGGRTALVVATVLLLGAASSLGCGARDSGPDAGTDAVAGGTDATGGGTDAGNASDATSTDAGPPPPCLPAGVFLFAGETLDFSFCAADPQIGDLQALYGLDPADVVMAFEAANPARAPYDFAGFGSRWATVRIPSPGATAGARLHSTELDVALLCIEPFVTTFVVNDDLAGAATDAGVDLLLSGPWDCLATTSPHTDLVPGNTPLGRATFEAVTL